MINISALGGGVITAGALFGVIINSNLSFGYQTINDDLIVIGSLGVGYDMTSNYSFGYDTLVFAENNLRIYFKDTSNTANFPANDWRIVINDSTNGGDNYFAIQDATSGSVPFRVDAGAPNDTIRVYENGDISLGGAGTVNVISVGESGYEGRITNLSAGVNPTDAVNYSQLTDVISSISWLSTGTNGPSIANGTGSIAIGAGSSALDYDTAIGYNSTITADSSTAIGANTAIHATNSVAIGADATVESRAENGTAIGQDAHVTSGAANSVALGKGSIADESNTVSVGSSGNERRITNVAAGVNDTDAVTYGQLSALSSDVAILSSGDSGSSSATGSGSLALGAGASARVNDTAIGYNSTVTADGSTAVGANTAIHSTNSVAVGANSTVESGADGGTAIGQGARVTSGASNSVALGRGSVADEPNTVSVGSAGNERRITNVAPGVNSTDAVNKGQLDQTNARVQKNTTNIAKNRSFINENRNAIQQNSDSINKLENSLDDLREESRAGIAAAAALIELMPSAPGKTTVNLGSATYKGEVAVGLTAVHRLSGMENMMLNTGISVAGDDVLVRAGASWEF